MKFMEFPLSKSMSTYKRTHTHTRTEYSKKCRFCRYFTEPIVYAHILSINDKLLTLKMPKPNKKKKTLHKMYTLIVQH